MIQEKPTYNQLDARLAKANAELEAEIAEREQVEEALRASEEQWKSLVENSPDHIMLLDTGYAIRFINHTVPDLVREQVIGKSNFDFVPFDSHPAALECFERVARSGKAGRYETRYITTKEEMRYFDVRISPLTDKGGNVTGFISTSNDVTEQRQAEEALRESKEIQDVILSNTNVLLAYLDREFNFVAVNQAYADAGHRRQEDFIGKNHFDLYPDAENEAIFNKVVETGDAQLFSAKPFEHPDQPDRGTTWWKWSLIPMKDESGNVQTLVFSLLDVTERVRAEEQVKASLQEKEVLLQEIHHRVKNNLAVISSLLSFQAEITPDERVRAAFQESQNRIQAMARIHEHLYRFSDLARIDMAQYVRGVANHLGQSFGMQAITLQVDVADVELDIDRAMPCGLIINELVSNALKHAFPSDWHPADSEPKVCIGMRLHGGECELTVSDNGVGLPPDFQIEGVGRESLGLRLAGILGRQLNGDLQASAEGGTTFRITFAIPER